MPNVRQRSSALPMVSPQPALSFASAVCPSSAAEVSGMHLPSLANHPRRLPRVGFVEAPRSVSRRDWLHSEARCPNCGLHLDPHRNLDEYGPTSVPRSRLLGY